MANLDPQTAIDTAFQVSKHILGAGEAGEFYRSSLAGSLVVTTSLTKHQRAELEKHVKVPLLYKPTGPNTSDHPEMVALREIVRQAYEKLFHVSRTTVKTLIVGAAFREVKMYDSNNAIEFYFGHSQTKDYDRIVKTALEAIGKELASKISKKDRRIVADVSGMNPRLRRYNNLTSILNDYITLGKKPPKYHTEPIPAEVLVFEDSIYEFDAHMILDLFDKTGANSAVGYALLPFELVFKDMPRNRLYYLVEDGDTTEVRYTNGYSNGYSHKTSAWRMLLSCPVIAHKDFGFSLVVEIASRIGPFAVFTLTRGLKNERIVRSISLPAEKRYYRVLDILKSVNTKTGKQSDKLIYFSVNEEEYISVINFLLAIDRKSMSVETAMTYMRRRGGGASLLTQEVLAPWDLENVDYYRTALNAYVYASIIRSKTDLAIDNLDITGCYDKIKKILYNLTYPLTFWLWPIIELVNWVFSENLTDKLVTTSEGEIIQRAWVVPDDMVVNGHFTVPFDDNPKKRIKCPICLELYGRLGPQKLKCDHKESYLDIELTQEELTALYTRLIDDDNDPQGLAAVKQEAAKNMPKSGFKKQVKAYYIKGGPGTGKSYIAKLLADTRDLIYAPFTKLKAEYMNVDDGYGNKRDLPFATVHRGFRARGCRRLLVDEFTSLPWEYQQIVIHLSGADEVFFLGDDRQTKVLEPQEGKYIGNYVDLESLSTHELLVNFRLKRKSVALLNTMGYNMEAYRQEDGDIRVINLSEIEGKPVYHMGFSHNTCRVNDLDDKSTVRANQGSTHDCDVALFISQLDGHALSSHELIRVAVSRHRGDLLLVPDGSEEASNFIARLNLDKIDLSSLPVFTVNEPTAEENPPELERFLNTEPCGVDLSFAANKLSTVRSPENIVNSKQSLLLPDNRNNKVDQVQWEVGKVSKPQNASSMLASILKNNPAGPLKTKLRSVNRYSPPPAYDSKVDVSFDGKDVVCSPVPGMPSVFVAEEIMTYFPVAPETVVLQDNLPKEIEVSPKPLQTGKNALEVLSTLVNPVACIDTVNALNELSSLQVEPGFRNGEIDVDVLSPINQRGHLKNTTHKYRSFCTGNGLHYIPNRPGQTWAALRKRYVGKKDKYSFTNDAKLLARKMVEEFVRENMDINVPVEQDGHIIMNEFLQSVKAKHYEEQYVGFDNTDARKVRFNIKEIFKPFKDSKADLGKVGQGISAWSKDAMLRFGACIRYINKQFKNCLKPHVLYDNRETDESSRKKIMRLMSLLPACAKKAVTDHGEFDAAQNEFTQELERELLRAMYVSEEFIAEYFSFRNNYILIAPETYCRADSEKTSGEPGTLLFNTIVAAIITNYVVRGHGSSIFVIKGDDGFKMQVGIAVDDNRYLEIKQFVNFELKIQIGDDAEFCGNAISGHKIVPSIIRKMHKLAAKRFRSYEHFTEYQISLRDWVSKTQNDDYFETCAMNAELYKMPVNEVIACFEAIQSASHIDKDTFERLFPERIDRLSVDTSCGINLDL